MSDGAPIGVGIVGTGLSATQHMAGLKEVPLARAVAVAGTSVEKARAFADKWGIPRAYGSWQELVADREVRAVHTCSPPDLRVPLVEGCAAAGKHVLVEKPMARTTVEADLVVDACEKAGVTLGAMFQMRFTPLPRRIKAALEAGTLGRLLLVELQAKWYRSSQYYADSNWRGTAIREGGAVLINQAIHSIDLLQWIVGPVVELQGVAATTMHPIEMEDVGLALLRFANGALGSIVTTTVAYPGFPERLSFHGEKGSATLIQAEGVVEWALRDEEPRRETAGEQVSGSFRDPAATPAFGHIAQFTDFYAALRDGRRPLVDGREARHALAIVEAIYRSNRERRPVEV